jgi:hypothetical protein
MRALHTLHAALTVLVAGRSCDLRRLMALIYQCLMSRTQSVPITRDSRAVSTTSRLMVLSPLISMTRVIWANRR